MKKKDLINAGFRINEYLLKKGYAFNSPLSKVRVFTKEYHCKLNITDIEDNHSGSKYKSCISAAYINCIYMDGVERPKFTLSISKQSMGEILCDSNFIKREALKDKLFSKTIETHYIYLIKSGTRFKIGITKYPENRNKNIGTKTPLPCELIRLTPIFHGRKSAKFMEDQFHGLFKGKNSNGEWFELEEIDIKVFDLITALCVYESDSGFDVRDSNLLVSLDYLSFSKLYSLVFDNTSSAPQTKFIYDFITLDEMALNKQTIKNKLRNPFYVPF